MKIKKVVKLPKQSHEPMAPIERRAEHVNFGRVGGQVVVDKELFIYNRFVLRRVCRHFGTDREGKSDVKTVRPELGIGVIAFQVDILRSENNCVMSIGIAHAIVDEVPRHASSRGFNESEGRL